MLNRFDRLWHDAVVSRDHEHHDVCGLRTACAHHRERFVTRRVEKHHATHLGRIVGTRHLHAVGADVLRDSARFTGSDVSRANRVEQRRLTVIDVAHDGDDGSARQFHVIRVGGDQFLKLFFRDHLFKRHE